MRAQGVFGWIAVLLAFAGAAAAQDGRDWIPSEVYIESSVDIGDASRRFMDIARPRVVHPTPYETLPAATSAFASHNVPVGGIVYAATPVSYGATHEWSEPFQLVEDASGYRYWRGMSASGDTTISNSTFVTDNEYFYAPPEAIVDIPAWVPSSGTVAVAQIGTLDSTATIKEVFSAVVGGVPIPGRHWALSSSGIAGPRRNAASAAHKYGWWPKGASGTVTVRVGEL